MQTGNVGKLRIRTFVLREHQTSSWLCQCIFRVLNTLAGGNQLPIFVLKPQLYQQILWKLSVNN